MDCISNLKGKAISRSIEDGKEQEIAYFGTSDKPFTVILLIDVSPSTAYSRGNPQSCQRIC